MQRELIQAMATVNDDDERIRLWWALLVHRIPGRSRFRNGMLRDAILGL